MSTWSADFPSPCRRLLIIGLDGATFDVLGPLMAQGRLPTLRGAISRGASGTLHSTVPPITPAAWTTFLTGKQPGSHGIIDFERYDPPTNRLIFNSTRCLGHVRSLWQILSDRGLRVGSLNVPMTYPAVPVNGFMISGFETPGPESDFVYPPELKPAVLERWPDPTLRSNWRHSTVRPRKTFQANIDYISRSFHQGAEMTRWLGEKFGWDVLMVVLKMTDNLQHKTWRYIDPRWSSRDPWRRDVALRGFEEADKALATLLDHAANQDATVMIVSDHGHGSLEGKVHPNSLLERWGYLRLHGGASRSATRGRHLWDRWRGRTKKFAREGNVLHDLAVDFSRTRACVMHAGMAGFLYVNLKDRQPEGVVEQSKYESLRDELRTLFLGDECRTTDPSGRPIQLFREAYKPEELYECSRAQQPWMPDLILVPHDSLAVVRKIRGRDVVRWLPWRRLEGTHRSNGIFVAVGPGIRAGVAASLRLVDCAPTILAMLGLRIPDDMEGNVITDMFSVTPVVEKLSATVPVTCASEREAYSARELQAVTERLSDLGYLE